MVCFFCFSSENVKKCFCQCQHPWHIYVRWFGWTPNKLEVLNKPGIIWISYKYSTLKVHIRPFNLSCVVFVTYVTSIYYILMLISETFQFRLGIQNLAAVHWYLPLHIKLGNSSGKKPIFVLASWNPWCM